MKRLLLIITILSILSLAACAREYEVHGPQGGLAMKITLPKDFDTDTQKCPMVILMHGIFSSMHGEKDSLVPMWCSEDYSKIYGNNAELIVVEGENHRISRKTRKVAKMVALFFANLLG